MTILIILVALIAIVYIFGRRPAQMIVFGGGVIGLLIAAIILAVVLFGGLWEWVQTNKTAQVVLAGLLFILVIRPAFASALTLLTKEKENEQGSNEEVKRELPTQKALTPTQIAIVVIVVFYFLLWLNNFRLSVTYEKSNQNSF